MQTSKFGIMQGRLSPSINGELQCFPFGKWENEISFLSKAHLDFIEFFIDEEFNNENPLNSNMGIERLKKNLDLHNSEVYSICFNYMIKHSLNEEPKVKESLFSLIENHKLLNYKIIVLPFYELSEINVDNLESYRQVITEILELAKRKDILVALETNIEAVQLNEYINSFNSKNLGVVYDTGNRVTFKVSLQEEIRVLKDKIFHVHLKDKNDKGNVLIGTGSVDFYEVFSALDEIKYKKNFVFESQRGIDPVNTAYNQLSYIKFIKKEAEDK
ncbi:hypothetical protein CRV01_08230 [Arcobacter sp. CECT 8983]|uniref:sugar phosphate isomerase/epimerase family protein n=1 Tax=Arcobacter sp. CECT 8983 TaxID=2044508 RepID=UPI00100B7F95|nr:sugar phosphate isomerase/epimerase [Arcobacter sp. CECT 8983]RXJ89454.1 hypothetical protein CRV01_08230 [Arcobacter sp. CECT 8983]